MEEALPAPPSQNERAIAMLAHVLQIFTWFVGPLIIYLVKRDSRFVAFHALQALMLQGICFVGGILMTIGWFAVPIAGTALEGGPGKSSNGPPVVVIVFLALFGLLSIGMMLLMLVVSIVYGIKAANGEWAEYPLIGRLARRWTRT
jgi:uncharacterized Tic20 family protein